MIKLINLLSEILKVNDLNLEDKYISANDLSKKLEPNPKEIYDFGGGKYSLFGDEAIVIDAFDIPKNICANLTEDQFNKMIDVSLGMKPLWENALGKDWEKQMNRDRLRKLYERF